MPRSRAVVSVSFALAARDYRAFIAAVRLLRRIMGRQAPDVIVLVQHTLSERDAKGIADAYLDSVGWPLERGRTATLARHHFSPLRTSRPLRALCPADPSRN